MLNITNNPALNFHPVFIPLNPIFRSIKTKVFRISPAISLLIFGLILVSCAGLSKPLEPPRVSLADIRVEKFTGFETVFRIQLRVINTNDTDLNVKGLEAQLEINEQPFAAGVSNSPVKIPSFGTELVTVTVYSSVINMFKSVYGLHESEELKYRLNGKLRVAGDSTFATTLPFESAGELTMNSSKELEFK
jgi:LEA14-like dessication related protein